MKETEYAILSPRWLPASELAFQDTLKIQYFIGRFHKLIAMQEETSESKHEKIHANNLLDLAERYTEDSMEEHMYPTAFSVMMRLCESMSEEKRYHCGGCVKLVEFCNVVKVQFHCKYIWLDTRCINHHSSMKLEESIQLMFNWY